MRTLFACLTLAMFCAANSSAEDKPDQEFAELDFAKVERKIAKEPTYVAEPRYALFCFGPKGETRMWAVADKSEKKGEHYDVLYFDLNADGDLTGEGERITAKYNPKGKDAGAAILLKIPKIRVPGTDTVHTAFRVGTDAKKDHTGFWFSMKYEGKTEVQGGYSAAGTDTGHWGSDVATAPIFRPTTQGKFAFGLYGWGDEEITLTIGEENEVYVMAGNPGSGDDTLTVVDEYFLDLKTNTLTVQVIAKDAEGKEVVSEKTRITQHC
jgi:hypothetical protein